MVFLSEGYMLKPSCFSMLVSLQWPTLTTWFWKNPCVKQHGFINNNAWSQHAFSRDEVSLQNHPPTVWVKPWLQVFHHQLSTKRACCSAKTALHGRSSRWKESWGSHLFNWSHVNKRFAQQTSIAGPFVKVYQSQESGNNKFVSIDQDRSLQSMCKIHDYLWINIY